jgi:hypothetical protein
MNPYQWWDADAARIREAPARCCYGLAGQRCRRPIEWRPALCPDDLVGVPAPVVEAAHAWGLCDWHHLQGRMRAYILPFEFARTRWAQREV